MPPLHELFIINSPKGAKVVLDADEALVQRQVRADGVLVGGDDLQLGVCRMSFLRRYLGQCGFAFTAVNVADWQIP